MRYKPLTDYSDITPFAKCPHCAQLLKLENFTDSVLGGSKDCPFCHSLIEKKEIIASCEIYLKKTRAIQSAEDIYNYYWALLIVFIENLVFVLFTYFGEPDKYNFFFFLVLIVSGLMLLGGFLNTQGWLSVFGKLSIADEEFTNTRRKIRRTQTIWIWAIIIYSIAIFAYIKFY